MFFKNLQSCDAPTSLGNMFQLWACSGWRRRGGFHWVIRTQSWEGGKEVRKVRMADWQPKMRGREPGRGRLFQQRLWWMQSVEEHCWREQGRMSLCWWYKHSPRFPSATDSLQQTKHWQTSLSSFSSLQQGSVVILYSVPPAGHCGVLSDPFLLISNVPVVRWDMRKSRLSFQFVFKIKCKSCVKSTVMVATIFQVSHTWILSSLRREFTWILSSLRRHLFHPHLFHFDLPK